WPPPCAPPCRRSACGRRRAAPPLPCCRWRHPRAPSRARSCRRRASPRLRASDCPGCRGSRGRGSWRYSSSVSSCRAWVESFFSHRFHRLKRIEKTKECLLAFISYRVLICGIGDKRRSRVLEEPGAFGGFGEDLEGSEEGFSAAERPGVGAVAEGFVGVGGGF